MSHGPSGEGTTIEPNLTPLLDVVLQLLMFFMMTVNFVNEQVTGEVKLPTSTSAVPISKAESDVLFINVKLFYLRDYDKAKPEFREILQKKFQDEDPCILVIGEEFPMKLLELKQWLKSRYKDLEKIQAGKVNTTIVIRAHGKLEYAHFFQILTMCKEVGFRQLRCVPQPNREVTHEQAEGSWRFGRGCHLTHHADAGHGVPVADVLHPHLPPFRHGRSDGPVHAAR